RLVPAGSRPQPALLRPLGARRAEVGVMKRLVLVLAALVAFAIPANAIAHPLGNFTINRYSEVDVSGNRLYVLYVLDLAEIPTFQLEQGGGIDAAAYARRIAAGTRLSIDGKAARLAPVRHALAFPPGQAGLRTTRLEVLLSGPRLHGHPFVVYRDNNYAGRIGWKEIVVRAGTGAQLTSSSAPSKSISDRLRAYPKNLLQSPLEVTEVRAHVSPGVTAGPAPSLITRAELERRVAVRAVADGGFASLIAHDRLGAGFIALSLFIAFFWGAAHA